MRTRFLVWDFWREAKIYEKISLERRVKILGREREDMKRRDENC